MCSCVGAANCNKKWRRDRNNVALLLLMMRNQQGECVLAQVSTQNSDSINDGRNGEAALVEATEWNKT